MEKLMILVALSEVRTFRGNDGADVKAIDVTLSDGINTIIAGAIEKRAQQLIDHPIKAGALVNVDLSFSVSNIKTNDGKEFPRQNVRINQIAALVNPD